MGVCGDISLPEERGGFVGIFNLGPMVCCISFYHGILELTLLSACALYRTRDRRSPCAESWLEIDILVSRHYGRHVSRLYLAVRFPQSCFAVRSNHSLSFLPETLRDIAGNGAVPLSGIHRALFPIVGPRTKRPRLKAPRPRGNASINPFPIFALPDITIALIFTGGW